MAATSNNIDDAESSSSTTPAFRLEWDVFLSFRGEDTRHCFTIPLHEALKERGVRAFLDDEGLGRGDEIAPSLLEAIEDSAAAIVIFSPRYADSHWCLEELAKISESRSKLVLPVFWHVNPSHVRRQHGPFEDDFRAHVQRFGEDKVKRWRRAMARVGGIAGWPVSDDNNSDEAAQEIIKSLVKRVLTEIKTTPIGLAEYTVGLDSRVENLTRLLDVKSNGVRVLGLHGTGGIGKTTLATALFNKLVPHFELRSFMPNVRETTSNDNDDDHDGLLSLQNKLVTDLSGGNKQPPIKDINEGIAKINVKVDDKRVLIVLDDVDNVRQVQFLIPELKCFQEGSRVIITARNRDVFPLDTEPFEVRELDKDESLQLFSHHAFRRDVPSETFHEVSEKIVSLTGGLPLALEVFGSSLFGKRRVVEWEDSVNKLAQIRPGNLQGVLRLSFDALEDEQDKCIFLDVACLLVQMGMRREEVVDILNGCDLSGEMAIANLSARSLVKVNGEDRTLWMHDQVRDMGRQIVIEENLNYPGLRSRVWNRNEIMNNVLVDEKGEKSIEGMVLDFKRKSFVMGMGGPKPAQTNLSENQSFISAIISIIQRVIGFFFQKGREVKEVGNIAISTKPIELMSKLRLLQINHVNLQGKFSSLPTGLRWLQWKCCPLKSLPKDFRAPQLAVLDLSESDIESLWSSKNKNVAENLVILNLSECPLITSVPDLSGKKKLKKLILERCRGLTHIHDSVGNMQTLIYLNLKGCSSLVGLPKDVSGLKSLGTLDLSGCAKLQELPKSIDSMKALKELLLDDTAISSLPESIFRLAQLEVISVNRCGRLKRLPGCIGNLYSLKEFSLNGSGLEEFPNSVGSLANLEILSVMWCNSLTALPDSIGDLKSLMDLSMLSSHIEELPESLGSLPNLKHLSMGRGEFLKRLPNSIGELHSLVTLHIEETKIEFLPNHIEALKSLEKLELRKCKYLKSLPESIGSLMKLKTIIVFEAPEITELPQSIGNLENLEMLQLTNCKELSELPSSIGNLKSLHSLLIVNTRVAQLPESFGMLSSLIFLRMSKKGLVEEPTRDVVLPASFSNLSLLSEWHARYCNISGRIPNDFEKLTSLEVLDLGYNRFRSLPSSLKGLSFLKTLLLPHCEELESLPPLPSSLLELDLKNCTSLETISDLSNLGSLQQLILTNCEKVVDIPGLESLKSLRRLYMSGCNACSSMVKKRLTKESLRYIRNISMPGSKIPNWFSQEEVTFSERKNRAIKAVIIGVVVSLINHQIISDRSDPAIVDVEAKILKPDSCQVFSTSLNLLGVPKTSRDQFHLCRYSIHFPLVSLLKDGYRIQVAKKSFMASDQQIELKKSGIFLVYEGDDDYEGDEESLNDSQQSFSVKLAKFFEAYEQEGNDD